MRILLIKSNPCMRLACALLLAAIAFWGCAEDLYYEQASTDYRKVSEHELVGDYPIKNRYLEGKIVTPVYKKKSVFTPEKVMLIQLDSSLAEVDTIAGVIAKDDTAKYRIDSHTYSYPYVKIVVKGKLKFLGSTAVPFSLETISDISNVEKPRVDLMTHLEVPLVEFLVDEGYPFKAAKQVALQKFSENFGLENPKVPAECYRRGLDEFGTLYQMFLLGGSDSAFVEDVEDFRLDMADGTFDDKTILIRFADYAVGNWLRLDSLMQKLDTTQFHWSFAEGLVERAYGLESCTDSTVGYSYVKAKKSKFKGDSLVCDSRDRGVNIHRSLTPWEREFGACTAIDTATTAMVPVGDSVYYICPHWLFDGEMWTKASKRQVLDHYLGKCDRNLLEIEGSEDKYNDQVRKIFKDSVYVCNSGAGYWRSESADTLSFLLGDCNVESLWNLKKLRDSSEYVCTFDSWKPANDALKFLSEQRPCDKTKDAFRTFSFDSIYYICADVKWNKETLYTFKDTTAAYADSLAFAYYLEKECAKLADTTKYAVDTVRGRYYHCELVNNVLRFKESDYSHAADYLNEQYVATLPACTAKSDTLELFANPYFEKTRTSGDFTYYHCANVGGKYQYEALDVDHKVTLEGLVDVYSRYSCDAKTDSLFVARDSIYRNYFHCEKQGGQYVFVRIDKTQADSYASYAAVDSLEPCVPSDTIQYNLDSYGYYYYCVDKGGALKYERISIDSLVSVMVDHLNTTDPCDASVQRWHRSLIKINGEYYDQARYAVCDYVSQDDFVWKEVSEVHYDIVGYMGNANLNLQACSADEIAARGAPVNVKDGFITDPRDGKKYRVATVGNQTWMAENLNYYDTLAMPNLMNETACADSSNCVVGAREYSWYAAVNVTHTSVLDELRPQLCAPVQGVCPVGWHIPSMMEWLELMEYAQDNKLDSGYGIGAKGKGNAYYAVSEVNAIAGREKLTNFYGVMIPYDSYSLKVSHYFAAQRFSVRCVKD